MHRMAWAPWPADEYSRVMSWMPARRSSRLMGAPGFAQGVWAPDQPGTDCLQQGQRAGLGRPPTCCIRPLALDSLTRASSYVRPALPVSWQTQSLFR